MGPKFNLLPLLTAFCCVLLLSACEAKLSRKDYDEINILLGGDGSLPGFNNPSSSKLTNTGNLYSMQLEENVDPNVLAELNKSEPSRQPGHSQVSESDAEKCMAIASSQLKLNLSKKLEKLVKKSYTQALEQFVALNQMTNLSVGANQRCTEEMHSIVEANLQCRAFPRRYVDRVIEYYRDLHANLCRPFFAKELEQKKEEFGLDKLGYIEDILANLTQTYVEQTNRGFSAQEVSASLSTPRAVLIFSSVGLYQGREIGSKEHTGYLYESIKPLIERDIAAKKFYHSESRLNEFVIAKVFEKYALKPCKRFVDAFSPSFELAAKIGSIVPIIESVRHQLTGQQVDALQSKYYGTWIRYKVCGALVEYGAPKMAKDAIELGIYSVGSPEPSELVGIKKF